MAEQNWHMPPEDLDFLEDFVNMKGGNKWRAVYNRKRAAQKRMDGQENASCWRNARLSWDMAWPAPIMYAIPV